MFKLAITTDAHYDRLVDRIRRAETAAGTTSLTDERTGATQAILDAVHERGDEAVAEFTAKFDNVSLNPDQFELTPEEIDAAIATVDADLTEALQRAHANIRRYHEKNLRQSWEEEFDDGSVLGQRFTAIESVGVYVPGGTAFYPSSVLMNIVPARVAGVREIVMVSPPSHDGSIHPAVLAAAKLAGATRIFRIGGAQAIGALAYGTASVPQVLKVTGPGNIYVTLAKRLVQGLCAIDTEAGPSEVLVIADAGANPRYVAAEMLAQAEHDVDASSMLVTTHEPLIEAVSQVIDEEIQRLSRADIIRQSLERNGAMIVVRDLTEAARITNLIAPEHLAVYTENPRELLGEIKNAGSIMLGEATTVVLGDYYAGPNHILPTSRRARYASPLTAEDFRKVSSILSFTPERTRRVADDVMRIANAEKLTAHARAIEIRK